MKGGSSVPLFLFIYSYYIINGLGCTPKLDLFMRCELYLCFELIANPT